MYVYIIINYYVNSVFLCQRKMPAIFTQTSTRQYMLLGHTCQAFFRNPIFLWACKLYYAFFIKSDNNPDGMKKA